MIRSLITLPLRSTRRGAELAFEGASRAFSLALALTGRSGGPSTGGAPSGGAPSGAAPSGGAPSGDRPGRPDATPVAGTPAPGATSRNGSAQASEAPSPAPSEIPPAPSAQPVEPAELAAGTAPPPAEPLHIEDEPELVAEIADPGAADGAGAELTIDEPWPGYRQLNADEIIARLPEASQAELAVMELYEATHKRRRTVISALQRQLNERAHRASADPGEH